MTVTVEGLLHKCNMRFLKIGARHSQRVSGAVVSSPRSVGVSDFALSKCEVSDFALSKCEVFDFALSKCEMNGFDCSDA